MPLYEFSCFEHGRFDRFQPMFSEHTSMCPECGAEARRVFSMPNVRVAIPITVLQELPHNQGYEVMDRKEDSSDSADRNYDIPPDYPNLLEV